MGYFTWQYRAYCFRPSPFLFIYQLLRPREYHMPFKSRFKHPAEIRYAEKKIHGHWETGLPLTEKENISGMKQWSVLLWALECWHLSVFKWWLNKKPLRFLSVLWWWLIIIYMLFKFSDHSKNWDSYYVTRLSRKKKENMKNWLDLSMN